MSTSINLSSILTSRPVLKWEGKDSFGDIVRIECEDGHFKYHYEDKGSWHPHVYERDQLRALEAMVSDLMEKQAGGEGMTIDLSSNGGVL